MRRRAFYSLAAAAALALTLGGCGGGGGGTATPPPAAVESPTPEATPAESPTPEASPAATPGGQSITMWVDETRQGPVEAAAQKFTADTGTTVNLVQKNFQDIRADFLAQVPTGQGPDVTVCAHDWLGELVKNGVVAPITLANSADFETVAIQAFTYDGQLYGLPYAIENIALIRNTDLAATAPATWDEAVAAGQAAGKEFPILIQVDAAGDAFHFYPFQTSFGAPVFTQNADGTYTNELAMGGDGGHAFAQWLHDQGTAGAGIFSTDMTYDIAVQKFSEGQSPFVIGGPWMIASFPGLNLSIDPIPAPGPNPAQPFVGVQGFCLSAQAPNALLANQFITEYLSTEEAQLALFKAGDRPPALTAAADKAVADDPIAAGFRAVGKDGVPMPSIPEMAQVWTFWGQTEADIISGHAADPVAAWDKMIEDTKAAIAGTGN